ncbi:FecR domain-containing protein [Fulvivirgaceae bacterium BMA12]|uniref:FecR domain-containing protein n=1 Tax=Agaribacillus aureus TaxID=3051825 RepID=A0ABT8L9H7_9BACT|nr:FecR domain-containing protein [Fulvivirgaceae bacterium BMA12]
MESGRKNIRFELLGKGEEKIMQLMSQLSIPEGKSKIQVWETLEQAILARDRKKAKIFPMWSKWQVGVAASLVLLIGVYFVFNQVTNKTIETLKGEQVVFYLPDSSKVTMNADSKITYNTMFWKKNRKIQLEGEAFFEVKRGKDFQVTSRIGIVEVLGTSFNVFARKDRYIVDCMTGKVKVSNKNYDDFKILTPGLSTRIENNQVQLISRRNPDKVYTWAKGEFYFEMTPLGEVIEELERQYDVRIQRDNVVDRQLYTGFFFRHDNLEESLELVFSPMGLKYEIFDEKEIKVSSENI